MGTDLLLWVSSVFSCRVWEEIKLPGEKLFCHLSFVAACFWCPGHSESERLAEKELMGEKSRNVSHERNS